MSRSLTSIFEVLELNTTDKFIMLTFCEFANPHGLAWPAVDTVALMTGFDRRTVQRTIAKMKKPGVMKEQEWQRGRGKSITYLIDGNLAIKVFGVRDGLRLSGSDAP